MTSAYPCWRLPVTGTCLPVCSSPAVLAFSRGSVRRSSGAVVQSLPVAFGTRLFTSGHAVLGAGGAERHARGCRVPAAAPIDAGGLAGHVGAREAAGDDSGADGQRR